MKIVQRRIWWSAVPTEDLAVYHVYYAAAGTEFSYALPFVSVPKTQAFAFAPQDFPAGAFPDEADYSIWVSAVDEVGNESDPLALSGRFDFIPPAAPATGGIESV